MILQALGGTVVVLALAVGVQQYRVMAAQTETVEAKTALAELKAIIADQRTAFEAEARRVEQENMKAVAMITDAHTKALADAKQTSAVIVSDLRAGNIRLRNHWQGCLATTELSREAADLAGADGAAELRAAGAGDLVRLAAEADAQVTALQRIIMETQ